VLVAEGIVEEEVDGLRSVAFPQFSGLQSKLVDQLLSRIQKIILSFFKAFYI